MPRTAKPPSAPAATDVSTVPEPAWRQRAIDRSTQSARLRAAKRVQRFLNSAREIIVEKESPEFTVQEVVDRSKQSLRSFYQYFDGKHELLLALFEEEMDVVVKRLTETTPDRDPLDRLRDAVLLLYELCSPGRVSVQPLFFEFAQRLVVDHPDEVTEAYSPVVEWVAKVVEGAGELGLLRPGTHRRMAAIVMQTATTTARRSAGGHHAITGEEVWEFCLHAIATDAVVAARASAAAKPAPAKAAPAKANRRA